MDIKSYQEIIIMIATLYTFISESLPFIKSIRSNGIIHFLYLSLRNSNQYQRVSNDIENTFEDIEHYQCVEEEDLVAIIEQPVIHQNIINQVKPQAEPEAEPEPEPQPQLQPEPEPQAEPQAEPEPQPQPQPEPQSETVIESTKRNVKELTEIENLKNKINELEILIHTSNHQTNNFNNDIISRLLRLENNIHLYN